MSNSRDARCARLLRGGVSQYDFSLLSQRLQALVAKRTPGDIRKRALHSKQIWSKYMVRAATYIEDGCFSELATLGIGFFSS